MIGNGTARAVTLIVTDYTSNADTVKTTQPAAGPKNAVMNNGLITATLMDCMAAIPCAGGSRPSAFIMKAEKAKKIPPTNPQPSAEMRVRTESSPSLTLWPLPLSHPRHPWRQSPERILQVVSVFVRSPAGCHW